MLELWYGTFLLEGLLYLISPLWKIRRIIAVFSCIYMIGTSYWLGLNGGMLIAVPMGILLIFRIGNMLRIIIGRMHQQYLRKATKRTTLGLLIIHSVLMWFLVIPITSSQRMSSEILIYSQLLFAFLVFVITVKNLAKIRALMPKSYLSDQELPTVTVAIPARNETDDLEECLRTVIANDYPKLEIIVLDDCSVGKTADIIRSFAQNGVRFISGQEPMTRWLAKNQAYEKLYQEASGDLIMFCGVDIRLGSQTIRNLVNLMLYRDKSMISVLPTRTRSSSMSAFIQPMRYWWELALPRRLFNRPAVLSSCWIIAKNELDKLGGFEAVSHTIIPEGFFARELIKTDKYSFIRSSDNVDVTTQKSLAEQRDTTIRTRYPQIRRRPENALALIVFEVVYLLLPFGLLILQFAGYIDKFWVVVPACIFLIATHYSIIHITNPSNSFLAVFNFPLVVIVEIYLGLLSMIKYEFFKVQWKDRNICIPVMHTIPKLPLLDDKR